jgi:hypothetical protein
MASTPPSLRLPSLRLIVSQDARHPAGGHAMLVLQGASRAPDDLRLVIRRRQPPEHFLGPEGWQPTGAEILADAQEREGGTTALLLGPAIVDRIKPYAKLEIMVPSLDQQGTLIWPELRQSPEGYLPTGGYVAGGVSPARGEKAGMRPPEPLRREPVLEPPAEAPPDLPEAPALAAEPKPMPPRRKPKRWPWLLLLLLVLLAGGLGAWQYFDRGPERLLCQWGVLDCTVDPCPPTMPLEERQACLVKSLTPDELFDLAEKLGNSGDKVNRDLAWWLFSTLADRSYSRAERELGLCYDPLLPEGCSLQPRLVANARQALQHYRAAQAEAEASALCQWLKPRGDLESQAAFAEFCT